MAVNKDGVYIAEDKDFQLISDYWIYKGEPLEVDITDFVNNKNLTSTSYMFSGWSTYEATAVKRVVLGKNGVTSMYSMFSGSKATSLDLSSFDTSSVTNMNSMFKYSQATRLDLSSFDTSRVTNMNSMFDSSQATSLDLSSFNTSSVTIMSVMFYGSQATTLDLSSFDTSKARFMDSMFDSSRATAGYARTQADAKKFNSTSSKPAGLVFVVGRVNKDGVYIAEDKDFQSIKGYWIYKGKPLEVDITDFVNSKKLTSTNRMFSGFSTYESTPVKRVVLGENSVTDMSYMFNNSQATSLDLSNFDTSSVTNMSWMFGNSRATSLDLSNFDTTSVTAMTGMFWDSQATTGYARTQADANKFNSSSNKPEGLVFVVKRVNKDGVYIAQDKDFRRINGHWIYKGGPLEVDITDFVNSKNLTSTRYMFSGSSNYEATAVKRVVLGKNGVTHMNGMFDGSQATSLDLSSFDTSRVTDMRYMFYHSQVTSLDLSSFDTSNVTYMSGMLEGSLATSLDLSNFDTSSVTHMSFMFNGSQATTLDLSSFDTSSVTDMGSMFRDSRATAGYARTQADADKFNSSSYKPAGLVFVVKQSFGTLDNLKINSMSYKDSNGIIKQVKTLKYKDNLGKITKLK